MILLGSTRFFANYDAGFKIISFGPKGSIEKTFFKKVIVQVKRQLWPLFSQTTDYDRQRVSFFWTPQGILSIMVQDLRSFL